MGEPGCGACLSEGAARGCAGTVFGRALDRRPSSPARPASPVGVRCRRRLGAGAGRLGAPELVMGPTLGGAAGLAGLDAPCWGGTGGTSVGPPPWASAPWGSLSGAATTGRSAAGSADVRRLEVGRGGAAERGGGSGSRSVGVGSPKDPARARPARSPKSPRWSSGSMCRAASAIAGHASCGAGRSSASRDRAATPPAASPGARSVPDPSVASSSPLGAPPART